MKRQTPKIHSINTIVLAFLVYPVPTFWDHTIIFEQDLDKAVEDMTAVGCEIQLTTQDSTILNDLTYEITVSSDMGGMIVTFATVSVLFQLLPQQIRFKEKLTSEKS